MTTKNKLPTSIALDPYELELETALEQRFNKVGLSKQEKTDWAKAAQKYGELQKSKRITLSINVGELLRFKARARANKIPYQTLINVILKQYNDEKIAIGL